MPLSTFVFYCGNVSLIAAYTLLALLSSKPGGVTGIQNRSSGLKWSTVLFFALAALLHVDMAVHAITRTPFFDETMSRISWDFAMIVFAKMAVVAIGLLVIARDANRRKS